MRILITGTAGYVGALLAERLAVLPHVCKVVGADRRPRLAARGESSQEKLHEEQGRLEDKDFVNSLEKHLPLDAVVHSAFAIRAAYGKNAAVVESSNLEACRNVFDFCFRNGVGKLIYLSTAAVYGARPGNRLDHLFKEDEPLREETYSYGVQKRRTEDLLREMYGQWQPETRVIVVRPCGITGPRFLSEPSKRITLVAFLKKLLPVIPQVSEDWSRQYLHEEDLAEAIKLLLEADSLDAYDVFNLAPNDYLTAADIGEALGKRTIKVPAWMVNFTFNALWHLTRGKIPTPRGSINFYRHSVNLDGSKITEFGFKYRYGSRECLLTA